MMSPLRWFPLPVAAAAALALSAAARNPRATRGDSIPFEEARIFFEFNQTDNDLGVHVFIDGEDWKKLKIQDPSGKPLFDAKAKRGFAGFGLHEFFLEGAEPQLDEVPLADFLTLFPVGEYRFSGKSVEGETIESLATFSHAVPNGPAVTITTGPNKFLQVSWNPVTGPAPGFPIVPVVIAGYQVIVADSFQVPLPASATSVTVPPESVGSLGPGVHEWEVLAIEAGGNQTITEGTFTL